MGILGLLGIRKINNLRTINGAVGTDPDQVHHLDWLRIAAIGLAVVQRGLAERTGTIIGPVA